MEVWEERNLSAAALPLFEEAPLFSIRTGEVTTSSSHIPLAEATASALVPLAEAAASAPVPLAEATLAGA